MIKDMTNKIVGLQELVLIPVTDWEMKIQMSLLNDGKVYIPARPLIDSLGLNWSGQRKRILRQSARFKPVSLSSVAKDGKRRRMLCITLEELPNFLENINLNRYQESRITNAIDFFIEFVFGELQEMAEDKDTFHRNFKKESLSKIKFLGRPKGDPDIYAVGLVEFGFFLIHRRAAENIDELLEHGHIRFEVTNSTRWYAGKDLCRLLGLSNYRTVLGRVSDRNKRLFPIKTTGGTQSMICINVDGLKEIVKACRKPVAKYSLDKYLDLKGVPKTEVQNL